MGGVETVEGGAAARVPAGESPLGGLATGVDTGETVLGMLGLGWATPKTVAGEGVLVTDVPFCASWPNVFKTA